MPRDALANPIALAVLGALLEQPMHPYQLSGVLAERGVPVNRGSLYDTVDAMARAGWIEPRPTERQGARPQRTPYAITAAGRTELASRLDFQIRTPRREFPEFLGAVSHLGVLGPDRAPGLCGNGPMGSRPSSRKTSTAWTRLWPARACRACS